ncbi:hypothetical protein ALQ71_00046 [Pseudomonas coronafaciens pv. striafaciens]|uniref:hypothetical protein n=1 Tax=Pseudomonas coronafaciens TaxID=53409 RepID=UPI000F4042BD|nr:hypothetical protein [Pseudomonas coronafaciens]RMM79824.1 hypothetical protein ALQ71_00046 [Pseudomonas coronafaciens pv. striafaciens]
MEAHEELLQAKLEALVSRFRAAVECVLKVMDAPSHIQDFPRGCCGIVSELMGDYLNTLGIGDFHYVCSAKDGASHAWLELDGLIIDITGDQFPDRPQVYVGEPDDWYNEWEEDTRHSAVHDPNAFGYGDEQDFLDQVIDKLNNPEALFQSDTVLRTS